MARLLCVNKKQPAYVLLISILVIGAVGLSASIYMLLSGLSATQTSVSLDASTRARSMTNACAEEALEQIRESTSFSGTGSLLIDTLTCEYEVINLGGNNREVRAWSTVNSATRKVKILIDAINPDINIASWQEVADF